jgi:hypothetical protein
MTHENCSGVGIMQEYIAGFIRTDLREYLPGHTTEIYSMSGENQIISQMLQRGSVHEPA